MIREIPDEIIVKYKQAKARCCESDSLPAAKFLKILYNENIYFWCRSIKVILCS